MRSARSTSNGSDGGPSLAIADGVAVPLGEPDGEARIGELGRASSPRCD